MQVLITLAPFVVAGIAVIFIAFWGGPSAAREAYLTRGGRVFTFGMVLLYVLLWRYEMAHKNTVAQLRSLKRKLAGDDGLRSRRSAAPELQV